MDDVVAVGGLVPSLLIEQNQAAVGFSRHVGTMDLDLGLAFALVDEQRYEAVTQRLRRAGFEPDTNEQGKITRQRWRISERPVTVDFLIETNDAKEHAGKLMNIEGDFAAIIAPGLNLAFKDRQKVTLRGRTILDEEAERDVWVCGPGAFVVLKALAFHLRGENKDAYDLYYVVRNYGGGIADVTARLRPLLSDQSAKAALEYLRSDFNNREATGPRRVAQFLYGRDDAGTQADVVGFVRQLIAGCIP
jgi:predicted nucleotidyltransferase